jgi:hypothetical protein
MSNVPPSDAYPPVDLTLAYRELGELSKKDGDLGYEYWNSVIELLRTAGAVRAELAEVPEARRALQERRKSIDMLLNSTEWVTRTQIESAQPRNASAVDDWQRHGKIFSVAGLNGESLYPAYQFDPAMRPLPVISDVLRALGGVPDRWMVVSWFHFPNGWLVRDHDPEGRPQAPKDFLDEEAAVVRAARLRNSSYVA